MNKTSYPILAFVFTLFSIISASADEGNVGSGQKYAISQAYFNFATNWVANTVTADIRVKAENCEGISGNFLLRLEKEHNGKLIATYDLPITIKNGVIGGNTNGVPVSIPGSFCVASWTSGTTTPDATVLRTDGRLYVGSVGISNIIGQSSGSGTAIIVMGGPIADSAFNVDLTVTAKKCLSECSSCNSIHLNFNLEKTTFGDFYGALRLDSELPGPHLTLPTTLNCRLNSDFTVITESNQVRQIVGPRTLTDIVVSNKYRYDMFMYPRSAVGTMTNGLYSILGNAPFRQITVENPDGAGSFNRLFVNIIDNGSPNLITYAYTNLSSTSSIWTYTTHNGEAKETLQIDYTNSGNRKIETRTTLRPFDDAVIYRERKIYDNLFGFVLTQKIIDPGGVNLVTTYTYFTNNAATAPNSQRFGQVKEIVYPDGKWEKFDYGDSRRVTTNIVGFLNNSDTTSDDVNRAFYYIYSDNSPHEILIEKLMGHEISRKYRIYASSNVVCDIQCQTPSAALNAADNMTNVTTYFPCGTMFQFKPQSVVNYDGTMVFYTYSTNSTTMTTVSTEGCANSGRTATVEGKKTVTVVGFSGQTISNIVSAITDGVDGAVVARKTYLYNAADTFYQSPVVTYLDSTTEIYNHSCCVLESFTDRNGATTSYTYDDLKRRVAETTQFGVKTANVLDAKGHVLARSRIGSDGSSVIQYKASYDLAGQMLKETNALGGVTVHSNDYSGGYLVTTTTYPNGGTEIRAYNRDGTVHSNTGTAVYPVRYDYGILSDGATYREYVATIKLDGNFEDTSEVKTNVIDMLKRDYKTIASNGGVNQSFYNNYGQLIKNVDEDAVTNIMSYALTGEMETNAIDMDGNGIIDLAGLDRIMSSTNDIVLSRGTIVRRTRTSIWKTLNNASDVIISTNETSLNGLTNWSTAFGLTTTTVSSLPHNGWKISKTTAPDSSYSISSNYYGRTISSSRYDANGNQISKATFGYDAHGRQNIQMDARTGARTYTFTASDKVASVTTPIPGVGQSAQTTTYLFDSMGRATNIVRPDNGRVTNVYSLRGELKQTSGARTYPVHYDFDSQGRMTNMMTWTNFALNGGARITAWHYHPTSGFLQSKTYPDGKSVSYNYTLSGKLQSRTWARGTNSTYLYDGSGKLTAVIYSDGTPGFTNGYDRLGNVITVNNGEIITSRVYNDAGQILTETYAGGALNGLGITNSYDSLLRRTNCTTKGSTTDFGYDSASRLSSVSDGAQSVVYAYLTNSSLVKTIDFKRGDIAVMNSRKDFDCLNRLTNIISQPTGASSMFSYAYTYNQANQRIVLTEDDKPFDNSPADSYWAYDYDSLGQNKLGKRFWVNGTPVAGQQFEYAFDDIGNRTETKAGADENGLNWSTATYTANELNQYTSRSVSGAVDVIGTADTRSTVTVNGQTAYRKGEYYWKKVVAENGIGAVYLSLTNRATLLHLTNITTGNIYVPGNPESFTYDLDGNMTSDGRWTNSWDAENRLVANAALATDPDNAKLKIDYTHDFQGRRIQKVVSSFSGGSYSAVSTNKLLYDGWNLIVELDARNEPVRSYMWGLDMDGRLQGLGGVGGLLSVQTNGGAANFTVYDGNGNIRALVNSVDGSVSAQYDYEPFGHLIRATGPIAKVNPFRFSTKYTDDETDLLYYGYRYYNASVGAWISRDPMEEQGGANLYNFVGNRPIDCVDRLGLITYFSSYEYVVNRWKRFDAWIRTQRCDRDRCCEGNETTSAKLKLTTSAYGVEVTGTAELVDQKGCVNSIVVANYFWWNCFVAQKTFHDIIDQKVPWEKKAFENSFDWHLLGYRDGEAVHAESHPGEMINDRYDSKHWNWQAAAIIYYCDKNGYKGSKLLFSEWLEWTWVQLPDGTEGWSDVHSGSFFPRD